MRALLRWIGLVAFAALALELFFVLRIAAMAVVNPESTTFQRSEAWAQIAGDDTLRWRQQWVPYAQISSHLKRAVIASEDDGFVNHEGVDWNAIEKAWERNAKAEAQIAKAQARTPDKPVRAPRIRGGSTITQQLAKNLLLSGERTMLRKGQEFVLTARPPRSRPPGRDAARPQAVRENAQLGLSVRTHADHSGAHGECGAALRAPADRCHCTRGPGTYPGSALRRNQFSASAVSPRAKNRMG